MKLQLWQIIMQVLVVTLLITIPCVIYYNVIVKRMLQVERFNTLGILVKFIGYYELSEYSSYRPILSSLSNKYAIFRGENEYYVLEYSSRLLNKDDIGKTYKLKCVKRRRGLSCILNDTDYIIEYNHIKAKLLLQGVLFSIAVGWTSLVLLIIVIALPFKII